MYEWRITKYDPAHRDARGAYLRDEWTSFSDVGRLVNLVEYEKVEVAYIDIALEFLLESAIEWMQATDVEAPDGAPPPVTSRLGSEELRAALRSVLRDEFWCRFSHPSGAFVHFGWDYDMYLGTPHDCPHARLHARARGLFVEPFTSPYHPDGDEEA